jgi:hypothetical protein
MVLNTVVLIVGSKKPRKSGFLPARKADPGAYAHVTHYTRSTRSSKVLHILKAAWLQRVLEFKNLNTKLTNTGAGILNFCSTSESASAIFDTAGVPKSSQTFSRRTVART